MWIRISTHVFMLLSVRVCTDSAPVNVCAWFTPRVGGGVEQENTSLFIILIRVN